MARAEEPEILEDLSMELKPADVRKYMLTAFEAAEDIALNATDPHQRFAAIKAIDTLYATIALKDFSDEAVSKTTSVQRGQLDEVRRLRKKPWDEDSEEK